MLNATKHWDRFAQDLWANMRLKELNQEHEKQIQLN